MAWVGPRCFGYFEILTQIMLCAWARFSFLIIRFFVYKYFSSLDYLLGWLFLWFEISLNWDTHNSVQLDE